MAIKENQQELLEEIKKEGNLTGASQNMLYQNHRYYNIYECIQECPFEDIFWVNYFILCFNYTVITIIAEQAEWLMKEHFKNQTAIAKIYDDEISRQRMTLEEKLARRRALAEANVSWLELLVSNFLVGSGKYSNFQMWRNFRT